MSTTEGRRGAGKHRIEGGAARIPVDQREHLLEPRLRDDIAEAPPLQLRHMPSVGVGEIHASASVANKEGRQNAEAVLQHLLLDPLVDWGVAEEGRGVVHLDDAGLQGLQQHHVEAKELEALHSIPRGAEGGDVDVAQFVDR